MKTVNHRIIDIHAHLAYSGIFPSTYISEMILHGGEVDKRIEEIILTVFLSDKEGKNHFKQVEKAGIEKTILLILDGGVGMVEPLLSLEEIYKLHWEILKKWGDKFIVFAGSDPRRGIAGFELFKKGIEEYGFKGLKLYPPMGYSMSDPGLDPYYEYCSKNNLPVLIHCGPSLKSLENHFADPMHIPAVAQKYPDLTLIMAHVGLKLNDESVRIALEYKNVYADISGFQTIFKGNKETSELALIFDKRFNEKILFGTDWPLFNSSQPIHKDVTDLLAFWDSLDLNEKHLLDNVLYNNSKKIIYNIDN